MRDLRGGHRAIAREVACSGAIGLARNRARDLDRDVVILLLDGVGSIVTRASLDRRDRRGQPDVTGTRQRLRFRRLFKSLGYTAWINGRRHCLGQGATPRSRPSNDANNKRGPYEEALLNTPVADAARPIEILRTVHSFDPCMACGVHVLDARGNPVTEVRVQ